MRTLRKNPGFTVAAVLTLALGIGANTAIFSLVHGVLLRPLPYLDDGDLVVPAPDGAESRASTTWLFRSRRSTTIASRIKSLGSLVEYHNMTFTLLGRGEPERVTTGVVSAEFFDLLGVKPISSAAPFAPKTTNPAPRQCWCSATPTGNAPSVAMQGHRRPGLRNEQPPPYGGRRLATDPPVSE